MLLASDIPIFSIKKKLQNVKTSACCSLCVYKENIDNILQLINFKTKQIWICMMSLMKYKKIDPIQLNLFSLILRTRFYTTEPIICTHMHNTYTHRGYQQSNLNNANINKFTHAHAYTHVLWVIILKTQCSKFILFSNISELHWQLFTVLCF